MQPRKFDLSQFAISGLAVLILIVYAMTEKPRGPVNPSWSGFTMGTSYSIKLAGSKLKEPDLQMLRERITAELDTIDREMSTYIAHSDVSRFNRTASTDPIGMPPRVMQVARYALQLSEQTKGAFDPTVAPLVSLWGFGPEGRRDEPDETALSEVRKKIGYTHLRVKDASSLAKTIATLQLDLNAVAKGFAVDQVLKLIGEAGIQHAFVEVGGEVGTMGASDSGAPWRIGIDVPNYDAAPGEDLAAVLKISDLSVATSGDYRNYAGDGEVKYSHIIDPRTGRPATHGLASVTVVHKHGIAADGIATALFVMGADAGLAWVEDQDGTEALFITRDSDGSFSESVSSGFQKLTRYIAKN